ncbi:MAG: hypothetical protein MRQ09_00030 [Candidatus Midichloria sp.]|nr:hypothetical protein [Candidatus Midichloria sp.]
MSLKILQEFKNSNTVSGQCIIGFAGHTLRQLFYEAANSFNHNTYEVNTWNIIKEGIGGGLAIGFLREIAFDPSKESTLQVFTSVLIAESIEEILRSTDHYIYLFVC